MMVSRMSDEGLWREIVGTADNLGGDLLAGGGVEWHLATCIFKITFCWHDDTPAATVEADAAMIAAVADRYSDHETKTGRMWSEISLLAREIAARCIQARKAPK